ncbi:MAG: tetratricopeptide repeat protein [Alphaproteobacteria bacterium]|nr:tetratricopeptide repeat protein [Alphaproteobacteria bacterium]
MSDIFREIEEEVRRERYAQLWKRYGDYIIAVVALVILAGAGFQVWRYYQHRAILKASQQYMAAEALLQSGHPEQAATAFAKIADTAPSGYAVVARLHNADALLAAGHSADALKLYKKVAAGDDTLLAAVAKLREGWMLAGTMPRLQLEALLAPLTDAASPWRFMAREILAYADYRDGKFAVSEKEYQALAADVEAPIGVRQRANVMATFLHAGGDKSFGVVPPAATPPAAKAATAPAPAKSLKARQDAKRHPEPHQRRGHAHR